MASKKNDLKRLLKENGFAFLRKGKHEQWHDGLTRITLPAGNGFDGRLDKMIRLQIRHAVNKREILQRDDKTSPTLQANSLLPVL